MKLSYKKRLLNQVLLASTVLFATSLTQGTVFANTEEIPPTISETVTPLPEETPITKTSTSEATDNLVEGKETEKQTEEIADTSPTPVSTEEDTTSSEPNAEETTLRTANNDTQNTSDQLIMIIRILQKKNLPYRLLIQLHSKQKLSIYRKQSLSQNPSHFQIRLKK